MIIIAGLGNPEAEYGATRHNAGFLAIDRLYAAATTTSPWKRKKLYEQATVAIEGVEVLLVKPLSFMNSSGHPVADVVHQHELPLSQLWLVYDDVTVDLGSFRIRPVGASSGGHNGVTSVIQQLGSGEFGRVRIGIGPAPENSDLAKYVLRRFKVSERERLAAVLDVLTDYMVASIRYEKLKEETIHV